MSKRLHPDDDESFRFVVVCFNIDKHLKSVDKPLKRDDIYTFPRLRSGFRGKPRKIQALVLNASCVDFENNLFRRIPR
jgi:hypothetical protein